MTDKIKTVGSAAEVFHGTAKHTKSYLYKKDLMKTKRGRIVSRRKHAAGLKAIKHLKNLGYVAKKGTFKLFHKSDVDGRRTRHKKHTKRHTRKRGGAEAGVPKAMMDASGMSHK